MKFPRSLVFLYSSLQSVQKQYFSLQYERLPYAPTSTVQASANKISYRNALYKRAMYLLNTVQIPNYLVISRAEKNVQHVENMRKLSFEYCEQNSFTSYSSSLRKETSSYKLVCLLALHKRLFRVVVSVLLISKFRA